MGQTNNTTALLLSPQCFLYEAMADIMDYNNEKMKNWLKLNQNQSEMLGGMDANGAAIVNKDGKLQGGYFATMVDIMEDAAEKEAQTMLDQATGEFSAGVSSAVGAGIGLGASGASLYRSFAGSSETDNLSKFQNKLNSKEENLGLGEVDANQEGIELQNLQNNNNNHPAAVDPEEQNLINQANERAEEIAASKSEMKQFMKDFEENPNAENQRILDALKNNHKAEANKTIENLIKDSKENDAAFHGQMNSITQVSSMGSNSVGQILKSQWDMAAADVKEKAGIAQAHGQVMQSTVQDMQSTKNSSLQTADKYGSSSTQAAVKYADIRV